MEQNTPTLISLMRKFNKILVFKMNISELLLPNFLFTEKNCHQLTPQERFHVKVHNLRGTLRVSQKCTCAAPFYQIYLRRDLYISHNRFHLGQQKQSSGKYILHVTAFECVPQKFTMQRLHTLYWEKAFNFLCLVCLVLLKSKKKKKKLNMSSFIGFFFLVLQLILCFFFS